LHQRQPTGRYPDAQLDIVGQGIGGILLTRHRRYLTNVEMVGSRRRNAKWATFTTRGRRIRGSASDGQGLYDSAQYTARARSPRTTHGTAHYTGPSGRAPGTAQQLGQWLVGEERRRRSGYRITGKKDRNKVTWWTLHNGEDEQSVITEAATGDRPPAAFSQS
jgi:hypothetical protein